ncbi:MAG: glycosyltransferase family 39 protein [Chitinophagales bacterium]|nr:glycosyltransferase family 39 protein [Chitinophagales bacterium]
MFVPLMNNDAAHHACIALRMYLTGDYVNLVDFGSDYLDKPHLHFWLSAMSFKIFGVNSFAYKLPSLFFSIAGIYATYGLGKLLYNTQTGKLAALILASAFAFILSNSDVRMDAILTSCIALSCWQLVAYIHQRKFINLAGAAFALALGFSTKGAIAVFVPAAAIIFYILYRKEWRSFLDPQWLLLLLLFAVLISPVLYCYYQQFNLHPEKVMRGKQHINGIKFILLNQSTERFSGKAFGGDSNKDYLFFIHSFAWAFAPWMILAIASLLERIKTLFQRKEEWLTPGLFLLVLIGVSFSGFKLPHYLNIVFPAAAIFTANYCLKQKQKEGNQKTFFIIQLSVSFLLLLLTVLLNAWIFPVKQWWVIVILIFLIAVFIYWIRSKEKILWNKIIALSTSGMVIFFFLMNTNFYPLLLQYQGGQRLAWITKDKVDPESVYYWNKEGVSSYYFYAGGLAKPFSDSILLSQNETWLLFEKKREKEILATGYSLTHRYEVVDFHVSRLTLKFLNPATREEQLSTLILAKITK